MNRLMPVPFQREYIRSITYDYLIDWVHAYEILDFLTKKSVFCETIMPLLVQTNDTILYRYYVTNDQTMTNIGQTTTKIEQTTTKMDTKNNIVKPTRIFKHKTNDTYDQTTINVDQKRSHSTKKGKDDKLNTDQRRKKVRNPETTQKNCNKRNEDEKPLRVNNRWKNRANSDHRSNKDGPKNKIPIIEPRSQTKRV